MIISAEKVNESYVKWCLKNDKKTDDVDSVEPFFQWFCIKKGFRTFRKIDGRRFEFSKYSKFKN